MVDLGYFAMRVHVVVFYFEVFDLGLRVQEVEEYLILFRSHECLTRIRVFERPREGGYFGSSTHKSQINEDGKSNQGD